MLTSALICRSSNVKYPIFAGRIDGVSVSFPSLPDGERISRRFRRGKNKKMSTRERRIGRRSEAGIYTARNCCFPVVQSAEKQSKARYRLTEMLGGEDRWEGVG